MLTKVTSIALLSIFAALSAIILSSITPEIALTLAADAPAAYITQLSSGITLFKFLLLIDISLLLLWVYSLFRESNSWLSVNRSYAQTLPAEHEFSSNTLYVFLAVMVLATLLRMLHLNEGMWIDEYLTLINYVRQDLGFVATNFKDDNQHWLLSVLSKVSILIFGEQPWAFRLPAVVFGLLSIWATYRVGRLFFSARVTLLACFLLTVSYHHIWYSQNARGYTILLLGTLLSVEFLVKAIRHDHWRHWILYGVSLALCVAGHLTGVFVGLAHLFVVVGLFMSRKTPLVHYLKPLCGFAVAAWIGLHLFVIMIPQMADFFLASESASGTANLHWKNPLWAITELLDGIGLSVELGGFLLLVLAVVAAIPAVLCYRKSPLFFLLASLPAILLIATMIMLGRNLWPRLMFNLAGFIVIYMSFISFYVSDKLSAVFPKLPKVFGYAPVVLLVLLFISSTPAVYKHPKQDFAAAYQFIENNQNNGDSVIAIHMAGIIYKDYYFLDWSIANSLEELRSNESDRGTTWVIYTLPGYISKARPELYLEFQTNYQFVKEFPGTLGDGEIVILKRNST